MEYSDEQFKKILRHLSTHFNAYWSIQNGKMTLSIEEAAAYSGIGMNKLRELTKSPFCDFVLYVGKKTLIKRVPFEEYINRATEV